MSQAFLKAADYRVKAKKLVSQMTVEAKASLCSGETAWFTLFKKLNPIFVTQTLFKIASPSNKKENLIRFLMSI
jgi:hypothetical protein